MVNKFDSDFGVPQELDAFYRQNCLSVMEKGVNEVVFEDMFNPTTKATTPMKSFKTPLVGPNGEKQLLVICQEVGACPTFLGTTTEIRQGEKAEGGEEITPEKTKFA